MLRLHSLPTETSSLSSYPSHHQKSKKMNPEITKLIEQYLNGELSESDKVAFEKKMNENEALRKEVDFQRQIHEAAKRLALKSNISSTAKNFHLLRKLVIAGVVTLTLAIATGIYYVVKNNTKQTEISLDEQKELEKILNAQAPIALLPTHYFQWKGNDTVFVSPKGVLISVPKDAFLENGLAYKKPILIQYQEAVDVQEIVKSGLSTMSGDQLLETQGMFGLKAFTAEQKRLDVNPKVGVYMQVPVDELKTGMMLFEGKETKDGTIDWQNPKKLQKLPTLAKMEDLNFYPAHYEDTLNKMKQRTDKKYRDSLYLSMEEFLEDETNGVDVIMESDTLLAANLITKNKYKTSWTTIKSFNGNKMLFKFNLTNVSENKFTLYGEIYVPTLKQVELSDSLGKIKENDFQVFIENYNMVSSKLIYKKTSRVTEGMQSLTFKFNFEKGRTKQGVHLHYKFEYFPKNTLKKEYCGYLENVLPVLNDEKLKEDNVSQIAIPPSKVLAFWKPKFDNTNLATRDFEKRMQAIHKTCDPKVLALYTKNLNLSLAEIDAKVVKMGYKEFQRFANENIGRIEPKNEHLENLQRFYEKEISDLRQEAKDLVSMRLKKEQNWDTETQIKRTEESKRTVDRQTKNFNEELEHNTESVYRQLGKKRPELINSVGFTITSNVAVYNIDKFVMDRTVSRTSGAFFDKETKKTAKLVYEPMKLKVANSEKYARLFVYLFPSKLSSYQRLDGKNGFFEYNLNQEFTYDLCIVAYKEDGYYFYSQKFIKAIDLGSINLQWISETKLNASLEQMNRGRLHKVDDMSDEIKWILREKQDYVVQKKRLDQQKFRIKIAKVVFPCMDLGQEYIPNSEIGTGQRQVNQDIEL